MKKLFTLILMAIVAVTACSIDAKAQWMSSVYSEADELKGTSSSYMTIYTDDAEMFVCLSSNKDNILTVATANGIFDYDSYNNVKMIIGFYKDGALVDRMTVSAHVPKRNASHALILNYASDGLPDKILNHLINVGDVRIITHKFRGGDFDITIPMNPDIKLLKQVSTTK